MATIRDLITRSLRLIEEVGTGTSPTASSASDALTSLIAMLDSWSIEGNMVYAETIETFPLTGGVKSYTIGSGGTFNTAIPTVITAATINYLGGITAYDLMLMSQDEYAAQQDKEFQGMPEGVYFNNAYPLATLYFYKIPNAAYNFTLYSKKALNTFASLDTVLSMPEGWERGIVYNLAVEIAPEYGKTANATVQSIAISTKNKIQAQISTNRQDKSRVDDGLLADGGFNILSGR